MAIEDLACEFDVPESIATYETLLSEVRQLNYKINKLRNKLEPFSVVQVYTERHRLKTAIVLGIAKEINKIGETKSAAQRYLCVVLTEKARSQPLIHYEEAEPSF